MVETLISDMINSNIDIKEDEIKKEYIDNYSQKEPSKKAHIFQIFTTDKQVIFLDLLYSFTKNI